MSLKCHKNNSDERKKKQASREKKVWRNYKSSAGKAWDTLKWLENEGKALAGLTVTALFLIKKYPHSTY